MNALPRLALATPATGPEPSVAGLAWLNGLARNRWRVQHFRARACPTGAGVVGQASGLPGRHLDSWLMPEPVLRTIFLKGTGHADLALVEGTLDETPYAGTSCCETPGQILPLLRALDLPVVAVVPAPPRDSFHLPPIPDRADAVFLDGVASPEDFQQISRMIRLTTRKPVVGAVDLLPELRDALPGAPRSLRLPEEWMSKAGESFLKYADLQAIRDLSRRHPFEPPKPTAECRRSTPFRVAYAQDEAFGAYFPDTLEALESLGADLVEFSPVRDERLPDGVDLVMIGCGFPDLHADALAANVSMIASLRNYVCSGQRIYSEGGGTAYLGRSLILGSRWVMGAGILPFDAELLENPQPPTPVERVLSRDCWIGPRGAVVRGYRSGRWRLLPGADPLDCPSCFGSLTAEGDAFFHHHAVGSLIHLHLGALADISSAFAGPHPASLNRPSAHR